MSNFAQTSLWKHANIKVHGKAVASPMQRSKEQEPAFSVNSVNKEKANDQVNCDRLCPSLGIIGTGFAPRSRSAGG
jgi:hypothetical protein